MDKVKSYLKIDDYPASICVKTIHNSVYGNDYSVWTCPKLGNSSANIPIFKYMRLSYLIELIDTSQLYISRRDRFSDRRDAFGEVGHLSEIKNTLQIVSKQSKKIKEENKQKRNLIWKQFVSCWTLNTNSEGVFSENYLLWKAYNDSDNDIVCRIGTTVDKLINSIKQLSNDVIILPVEYQPNDKLHIDDPYWNTFVKTEFYKDEREIRMLALSNCNTSDSDNCVMIPLDLNKLLTDVTISPFLSTKSYNIISNQLLNRYPFLSGKINKTLIIEY